MKVGFLIFIGLPASGKTTLAKQLKKNNDSSEQNNYYFIHVCYDELLTFSPDFTDFEWKSSRSSILNKIENLVIAIKKQNKELCPTEFISQMESITSSDCDIVLIIDDNMYFKSMRYSLYQIAKKKNISFCQVYLDCSLDDALKKNSKRDSRSIVPPHVIEKMSTKIEPPCLENFWERYSIFIDSFCDISEFKQKLFPVLSESLESFEYLETENTEKKELSLLQCKMSVLHQSDIALRKIVGSTIKEYLAQENVNNIKEFSSELIDRKSGILHDIKIANICLPSAIIEAITHDILEQSELIKFLNQYF